MVENENKNSNNENKSNLNTDNVVVSEADSKKKILELAHQQKNAKNYSTNGKNELEKDYFKIDADEKNLAKNQAKAINFIAKVEEVANEMISYGKKYNQADKEVVTRNLRDLILILDSGANTFLSSFGYSQVFNVGYVDLQKKLGKIIVTKLPNIKDGDLKPLPGNTITKKGDGKYATGDGQIGNWKALLHDKNFYKINDAINLPKLEGVFVNTSFYEVSLKNVIGKWYWAVQGCIKFVNAAYWQEKTT